KLGHSYSKEIHEILGRYTYELKELKSEELDGFFEKREFTGINVTIPYKETVIPYLDEINISASKIGAVNTIVNRNGKLTGYNTDYYGFKALIKHAGMDVSGCKVLILGSGGTSKTAFHVLNDLGAGKIVKVSRSERDGFITYEQAAEKEQDADFIVNTTPVGMFGKSDDTPIDLEPFKALKGVLDVIYNPINTKLVLKAKNMGIKASGGLFMLVEQAMRAAEFFLSESIPSDKTDEIYRKIRLLKGNISLVGMPGSGKSTLGKILAKELSMDFVDTDAEIVKAENREISDIFASDGEAYFRKIESETVALCSGRKNVIISTGGGAVLDPQNISNLKKNGVVIFLDRDPAEIRPTDDRPLGDTGDKILNLYKTRLPIYKEAADITVRVTGTPESLAEEIGRKLDAY
ncbi:MAG: shikimate dehydrogenase, partial [Lachnospiraceae bacterium]|nr:shikimate dehydrogenase [Lachnospiraceae bacterium]